MTQQIINVGTGPDSYTGESLRTAFQKVNENFSQLYVGNIGANISGNIVTANGFVTSGAVTTGTVAAAGNISAYYFTGNGSQLTGITSAANTGDIAFSGQTISGTIDGNIVIDPYGGGNVNIISRIRTQGLRVGNITDAEFAIDMLDNTATINTAGRGNGNVSLRLAANNNSKGSINIRADNGHMGFGIQADGYDYIFNGEVKANAYYADANFPVGYQFTTPGGDTGMSHDYQNDIHGNASVVIIKHDSFAAAKFYDNNHSVLSGNLIVSQDGNVFGSSFSDALIQTYADVNSYAQSIFQNLNSGNLASSDFILTADNGDDSSYYGDFGIASSTYNYPGFGVIKPNDVYILAVGANITGPGSTDGANLILGSTTGNIKMFVGIPEEANVVATFSTTSANIISTLGNWEFKSDGNLSLPSGGLLQVSGGIVAGPIIASPAPTISGFSSISAQTLTASGNISGNVNGYTIGYRDIPQVSFTSNATLALADAGKHYFSSNSANVITIPNNTTVSFSIGTAISIVQQGTANLTVTPGSGVTMYLAGNSTSSARTLGNYGMATLMKVATDTWFINGTGVN